jgi:hypothetical protein
LRDDPTTRYKHFKSNNIGGDPTPKKHKNAEELFAQ